MSQRVPEFTAKYKVFNDLNQNQTIYSSFAEVFSFENTCSLENMQFKFDTEDVEIKVIIDGFETVLVDARDLDNFEGKSYIPDGIWWDYVDNVFYFKPSNPIQAKESIKVYARFSGAGTWWGSKAKCLGHIVNIQHWS